MIELSPSGIKERDPRKWKVLKTEQDEEGEWIVTFQAGVYVNRAGMEIPVIFYCAKSGIIFQTWKREMEKREKMAK